MNYSQIKEELIEKIGNNCHCYNGKIRCFTRCSNILNNVRARIERGLMMKLIIFQLIFE